MCGPLGWWAHWRNVNVKMKKRTSAHLLPSVELRLHHLPAFVLHLDFTITQIRWTASFLFSILSPHRSPCMIWSCSHPVYDTILSSSLVWYYLVDVLCMILSGGCLVYNINLQATTTTILSTGGVTIPINLVSSAMDSIRQCIVLFKAVVIPTSDPKSEFLCQSSVYCAEPTDPLNHLVRLGYLPHPHPSHITLMLRIRVLLQSISNRSCVSNKPNALVTAIPLKSSRVFHLNVTFWWLGALSKMNRACASPFVRPLKMLIMWLTWASRWSAVNHPSLFLPGQKMIWASLPPGVGECEWDQRTRPATVHLLSSHKHTQSAVKKSETIREMPSPFAFGISLPRHPNESAIDHFDKMWICHVWWEQDGSAQEKDEGAHFLRCPKCEIDICRF